jgi:asparagine synthase (glutamine-hydrolysing)
MPCERLVQAAQVSALEPRYPYAARALDALLRSLPQAWRHAPGQPKRILRELLARRVPRALWDAPKHGFNFPLHDFLGADGHALVHRHVLQGRWLARGRLHAELAHGHARRYLGGERRLMFRVWALVVLGAWLDAHEHLD